MMRGAAKNDFSRGSIPANILQISIPILVAEFVNVLYNLVDRMYIGHLPGIGTDALSGVGLVLPVVSLISAFASLLGTGGAPLCSIARGGGNSEKAQTIMETAFTMLVMIAVLLTGVLYFLQSPMLYLLGADAATFSYAREYFGTYVLGTVFSMISLGMNPFINAQGFSKVGMGTVILGAGANLILDPLFIFKFGLGVRGAAIATVLSQMLSAVWVLAFLADSRALIQLRRLQLERESAAQILRLGASGFMFKATNGITQAVVNVTLRTWGGAMGTLYIGAMSIINALREVVSLPIFAITSGAQPVISYNYGAKQYHRVSEGIRFMLVATATCSLLAWACLMGFPGGLAGIFTTDEELLAVCIPCARIYFGTFFLMCLQMTGQNTYVALNRPGFAVFFSLFRKVILVVPLTLLLPYTKLGVRGVFYAEMFSQIVGATACFATMVFAIWRRLNRLRDTELTA